VLVLTFSYVYQNHLDSRTQKAYRNSQGTIQRLFPANENGLDWTLSFRIREKEYTEFTEYTSR